MTAFPHLRLAPLLALVLLPGCVSVPASRIAESPANAESRRLSRDRELPPPESRFLKVAIPAAGAPEAFPAWRTRSPGRPVLLLHAINGLSPALLHFALELETWGYRVYLPSLYGDPIGDVPAYGFNKTLSMVKHLKEDGRWNPISTETLGPIVDQIGEIARWVDRAEGGRGIVVMGNSLTGAIPLSLLAHPSVRIAVLAQPATPAPRMHEILLRVPPSREEQESLSLSPSDWKSVVRAMRRDPRKRVLGFHYLDDPLAEIGRFDVLHERLAEEGLARRFTAHVLAPPGKVETYSGGRESWTVVATTTERAKMLTPHSTFIDPNTAEDRDWFRKQLRESLRRVW